MVFSVTKPRPCDMAIELLRKLEAIPVEAPGFCVRYGKYHGRVMRHIMEFAVTKPRPCNTAIELL